MSEFYLAWSVYIGFGITLLLALWHLLSVVGVRVRRFLWALIAALTFMPWYSYEGQNILAPAIFIVVLDMLSHGISATYRAGVPLISAMLIAVLITFLVPTREKIKSE